MKVKMIPSNMRVTQNPHEAALLTAADPTVPESKMMKRNSSKTMSLAEKEIL